MCVRWPRHQKETYVKITDELKSYVSPRLIENGFVDRLAEPLPLTLEEIDRCRYTDKGEEIFLDHANLKTPLKMAKLFQKCAKGEGFTPDEMMSIVAAAYFFRSVYDEYGYLNIPSSANSDGIPWDSGMSKKEAAKRGKERDERRKEVMRRCEVITPLIHVGGKSYQAAINKGVIAIEYAVTSTLTLIDLKQDHEKALKKAKKGKRI
jgi:hypothetical protein